METASIDCGLRNTHVDESAAAASQSRLGETRPRAYGFTLVELLVVITIISLLAALITVAAIGALKKAQETRIKTEINQMATAVDDYKNKMTAYPPNCQTDGSGGTLPLDEAGILNDVRRHVKQLAPRTQEPDDVAYALTGQTPPTTTVFPSVTIPGGLTADEAIVFWLGGFSSDPKYPISGDGGPSFPISAYSSGPTDTTNAKLDPVESRKWIFPFDVSRLGPRDSNNIFNGRYVEYVDPKDPTKAKKRRINFWKYYPPKSNIAYLYFDTSRHPAAVLSGGKLLPTYDPPAATLLATGSPNPLNNVYPFKKKSESAATGTPQIQYVNPDKYQIIHCGLANAWDEANFPRMSANGPPAGSINASDYLLFPTGPFTGDIASAIVNFIPETRIEDAQK